MDLSRRGFLKLFGVGAGAAIVAPTTVVRLFGSDEEPRGRIIRPGQGLGKHWVVYPRPTYVPGGTPKPSFDGRVIGCIQSAVPKPDRFADLWSPSPLTIKERVIDPGWVEGMDPHAAFYKASMKLREMFTDHTRAVIEAAPGYLKHGNFHVVTVIHSPIYARPGGTMSGRHYEEGDGFEVVCDYDMYLTGTLPSDLSEYEAYSDQGEYPIDVPSEIEMGLLLKLDEQIVAEPQLASRRGFFARWRA